MSTLLRIAPTINLPLSPEDAERAASVVASGAPDGMEGWRKAGALLTEYRRLHAAHQMTLRELAAADAKLAAITDEFWPEELPEASVYVCA